LGRISWMVIGDADDPDREHAGAPPPSCRATGSIRSRGRWRWR
jgi:hypothetical protein